ncbi:MAG: putative Ig domain-containing protein, partial [Magnetospirillum sp.]|nr:putative Ig domain-containing protein [Magnetospirillum sp.]
PSRANDQTGIFTVEDTPISGSLSASDIEGQTVTFSVQSQGAHGAVTLTGSNWIYTPAENYSGSDTITLRATDALGAFTDRTITVTVAPVNDAPVLSNAGVATIAYNVGSGPVAVVENSVLITDADSAVAISKIQVSITGGDGADTLVFSQVDSLGYEMGTINFSGGTATVTGDGSNAMTITFSGPVSDTIAHDVLRSIMYANDTGGATRDPRVLHISLTDDAHATSTITRTIDVNTPPDLQISSSDSNVAMNFVTVDDHAATGTPVTTQTSNVTVETWINWSGVSSDLDQWFFYNGNSSTSGFGLGISGNNIALLAGGQGIIGTTITVVPGEWHHVAAVREGNGDWQIYYDGNPAYGPFTQAVGTLGSTGNATTIGNTSPVGTEGYIGQIDSVMVWETARSAPQILADMQGATAASTPNLVAYWQGDTYTDGAVYPRDSTSNSHNILLDAAGPDIVLGRLVLNEGETSAFTLTLTDDADMIGSLTPVVGTPLHGTLTHVGSTYFYTPDANFAGEDSVSVTATDSQGATATYEIDLHVNEIPDAPTSTAFADQHVTATVPFTLDVGAHFADLDAGENLTYDISNMPNWLSFDSATGILSGTPPAGTMNGATLGITATDKFGLTTRQDVAISFETITALGANQAGASLRFDGNDDYAQAAATTLAVGTGDFTMEAWVNPITTGGVIVAKGSTSATNQCTLFI